MIRWKGNICFLLLFVMSYALSAQNVRISGIVTDAKNGESLPGVSILLPETGKGVVSNRFGHYSVIVPPGIHELEVRYVGYRALSEKLKLNADTIVNWYMVGGINLSEITVSSKRLKLSSPLIGVNYLTGQIIEKIPVVLGEKDVLKTLQLLPGVKGGNEGTSGIQVRGGSHDQNLILLDGVPVYNTNHLFGYLSTFNAEVVKDVKFFKGSIPAQYGGRLSSVIDVSVKEGNLKKHGGKVSVSPVSGRLYLEGPIKKDTASYLVSVRRSWLDIPYRALMFFSGDDEKVGYSFYDVNGKVNWIINDKNRLYLSHYQGRDGFFNQYNDTLYNSKYEFNWDNYTSLVRWNHLVSPSFFINTSVYYSLFRFNESTLIDKKIGYEEFTKSKMADFSVKSDANLNLDNNTLNFGYHISSQLFMPSMMAYKNLERDTIFESVTESRVYSAAGYIENEYQIHKLTIKPGVRILYYNNGEHKFFVEPKFASVYKLNKKHSIKFSFQRMVQPIHLLTNTSLNMPTDLWVPAIKNIKPATSWQFDLEYTTLLKNDIDFTWNAYYKPIKNIIRYKQGVSYMNSTAANWTEMVDVGEGLNYGTELMLEKTKGRITGWFNYTLAWALRKVEGLNNNEYFPFKYDRRHDVNLVINYSLKETKEKHSEISVLFKYATGNAITIPVEYYAGAALPGMRGLSDYYSGLKNYTAFPYPNNYRMPAFHHLDLAYSITKKLDHNKERNWTFSVYNVYNRMNPYYYYKRKEDHYQISLLPIIPSVTFSYKW
jgi:hypothetical protein